MGWLGKTRAAPSRAAARPAAEPARGESAAPGANLRASNALKDFLWLVGDVPHGNLLDLGPVWQSTVSFFTERGFRVHTEDVLRAWKDFLREEEKRLRTARVGEPSEEMDAAALAERFLAGNLVHPPETFDAVLVWDLLDYLDAELLPRVVARLYDAMRSNAVLLGVFHSRTPDAFHRYRIRDAQHIELVPAAAVVPPQRALQNREILNLFARFRSSKAFVGRDQLREGLFTK
jgi:hypothetical protein